MSVVIGSVSGQRGPEMDSDTGPETETDTGSSEYWESIQVMR